MAEDDEELREFGNLSKEEKMDLLRRLSDQLDVEPGNVDDFGFQGEVQVRVLDEDGEEKTVETESFKC